MYSVETVKTVRRHPCKQECHVMRLQLPSIAPSAAALIGLALAKGSRAATLPIEAASAVRGSLGVSIEDLVLSGSGGATVFFLNAGCALLFAAAALVVRRRDTRHTTRIPFRPTSNFAR
jgi:hypothetical protein